jgi:hypothetical protein
MNNVILITENELQEKIDFAIQQAFSKVEAPKPIRKSNLDLAEAKEFLISIGYKCSDSQLYKLSMKNEIPMSKFGRRIMFNADELTKWVEAKKQKRIDVSMAVCQSANSKLNRP